MDGHAALRAVTRQVLAVGIALHPQDHDGPPGLETLPPLAEARACASEVARALGRFDYVECPHQDEGWDPADEIRRALTSPATSMLVVHIVAHGELSPGGESGLHVI